MPPLTQFKKSCLALAISPFITLPAKAATIDVTSAEDDGTLCTLREAITAVNNADAGATGCVPVGPFGTDDTININLPGSNTITLTEGSGGQLTITEDVTINGSGADMSIIDGGDEGTHRVLFINGATVNLNSMTITGGGSASNLGGGGFFAFNADVTINSSVISGNSAQFAAGIIARGSTVTLNNTRVSDNVAETQGGGISVDNGGTVNLTNSTVSGNSITSGNASAAGAGINNSGSLVELTNSTVSGNSVGRRGGGIIIRSNGITRLDRTTVSDNTANIGGGINLYISGTLEVSNSIISGNVDGDATKAGAEIYVSINPNFNTTVTLDNSNLLGSSPYTSAQSFYNVTTFGGSDINATIDGDGTSTHIPTELSSILGPLADNGGPTLTHALANNSPAIDAGDEGTCPETDQRGQLREDGACDIGSFEFVMGEEEESCYVVEVSNGNTVNFCL